MFRKQINLLPPLLLAWLWCGVGFANDQISDIIWIEVRSKERGLARDVCANLGQRLLATNPTLGFGAFTKFNCYMPDKKFKTANLKWHLRLREDTAKDELVVEGFYHDNPDNNQLLMLRLPNISLAQLGSKQFDFVADYLAYYILDSLPVMMRLDASYLKTVNGKHYLHIPVSNNLAKIENFESYLPTSLFLYTLQRVDDRYWKSKVLGRSRRVRIIRGQITVVEWSIHAKLAQIIKQAKDKKRVIWAHNERGPGLMTNIKSKLDGIEKSKKDQPQDASLLSRLGDSIMRAELDALQRLYIGLRYGVSFIETPAVLKKSQLIGLLIQADDGWLEGLRIYYDLTPEVSAQDESGATSSLYSARTLLGWSLDLEISDYTLGLIDYVDASPKIGGWSFKSTAPIAYSDGTTQPHVFETKRALAFGWEIGAEKRWTQARLRLWYGADFAGLFNQDLGGTSVSSMRYGSDLFIKGPQLGDGTRPVFLSFLLFSFLENVLLVKTDISEDEAVAAGTTKDFQYMNGFAGAGIAIAF